MEEQGNGKNTCKGRSIWETVMVVICLVSIVGIFYFLAVGRENENLAVFLVVLVAIALIFGVTLFSRWCNRRTM